MAKIPPTPGGAPDLDRAAVERKIAEAMANGGLSIERAAAATPLRFQRDLLTKAVVGVFTVSDVMPMPQLAPDMPVLVVESPDEGKALCVPLQENAVEIVGRALVRLITDEDARAEIARILTDEEPGWGADDDEEPEPDDG